jgi:hypothetical protein
MKTDAEIIDMLTEPPTMEEYVRWEDSPRTVAVVVFTAFFFGIAIGALCYWLASDL